MYNLVKSSIKLFIFYLLCFFGGIGVHKFYVGKTGVGICYLIFSLTFIPMTITFFEAIIAVFKPADSNGNIVI